MTSVVRDQPWANAYDLVERLRQLPAQPDTQPHSRRRLEQWQQLFHNHHDVWTQRVESTRMSEAVLQQIFASAPATDAGSIPGWWDWITQAWHSLQTCLVFDATQDHTVERFLHVVEPLIAHGIAQLRQNVQLLEQQTPALPFDPAGIQRVLFARLPNILLNIILRTLVLELNVARMHADRPGSTAESRFNDFIASLKLPATQQAIFSEYPVLARAVATAIEQWVDVNTELLQRLTADWAALEATLAPGARLGTLTSVQWSGDRHHNGRSVAILGFDSGRQVVYKPKSVTVEAQLQTLLGWINAQGISTPFRLLNVLEGQGYGWVEFIRTADCREPAQIERFYRRQGAYLALLYLLNATDFHAENIIAAGEYPMLIDLESLFHTPLTSPDQPASQQAVVQSVLQVGMLPQRWWASGDYEGIDLSGLGGAAGQLSSDALPEWQATNTDAMHLVRKRRPIQATKNRPTLNGADVDVQGYRETLIAGFQEMYQLLIDQRPTLATLLEEFSGIDVRVIARATRTYSSLLNESFHPDLLRNALDRDLLFERLWFSVRQQPQLAALVPIEQAALRRGDIPLFTTQPASRAIWSDGTLISDFFAASGLEQVRQRLDDLSAQDCERQLWVIRQTFNAAAISTGADQPFPRAHSTGSPRPLTRQRLVGHAQAIGDHVLKLAFQGRSGVTWLGLNAFSDRAWGLVPINHDLYAGSAGIALFLAQLGQASGDQRYRRMATAALDTMRRELPTSGDQIPFIGGFNGWGSAIYTLTQLGVLWNSSTLLDEAQAWSGQLAERIAADRCFDVMGGAAGAVVALLELNRQRPDATLRSLAIQCGNHLLDHALPAGDGVGWQLNPETPPLAGFSHGASGVGWALARLARHSPDPRYLATAQAALRYENGLFAAGNWRDLRGGSQLAELNHKWAWCHGAPGIGLARAAMLPYLDTPTVRADLAAALESTRQHGFGGNHSLCHGDLGNLELFLTAAQVLNDSELRAESARLAAGIVASIEQHGWLCGTPQGAETLGLMTGLAGIGYMLLRIANPETVPAVLTLATPG